MEKYITKEKAIIMQLQWFISLLVVVKCRTSCSVNQWENNARKRCQVSIKKRVLKVCCIKKYYTKLNQKVSVLKRIKIKV
jgi:Tfp pilus assembly protein PilP